MFVPRRRGNARKRTKAKRATTKRKPVTKAKGVSQAVARYVKTVLHKNIENKVVNYKDQISFASYQAQLDLSVQPIYPSISVLQIPQGVGQGQRCGNTIKTRRLGLKYTLFPIKQVPNEQNDQPTPQDVIVWIGYLKNNRQTEPSIVDFAAFFQEGNTAVSPVGNLWDLMSQVNTDLFTICKVFRHKVGNAIYTDYAGIKPSNYYSNNDYKLNCGMTVDLTKYINKTIKFDDDSLVSDTGLYMWMTAVNADSTIDQFTTKVGMYWNLEYQYEDA